MGQLYLLGKQQLLVTACIWRVISLQLGQDEFNHYAAAMTKYFVAEGIAAGHDVLLVSPEGSLARQIQVRHAA